MLTMFHYNAGFFWRLVTHCVYALSPLIPFRLYVALLLVSASPLSTADGNRPSPQEKAFCSVTQSGCIAVGEWDIRLGIGAGLRSNPLIDGDDLPIYLLPELRYYGERFFFDTYTGGFTFYETDAQFFNSVVTIGFDQIYFKTRSVGNIVLESGPLPVSSDHTLTGDGYTRNESDAGITRDPVNNGSEANAGLDVAALHRRRTAGLAGFEYGFYRQRWEVSMQLLQDVTDVHNGQEVRAAAAHAFTFGNEAIEMSGGFSWQSATLLQYYYGIEASEVADPSRAYQADDGISPFIRIDWRRRLRGNWGWQATLHHRWLPSAITNSPLLDEHSILTLYLGGVYHF